MDLIPGLERPPGVGNNTPLQCSCLGNFMGRGVWRATVHGGGKELYMTEHTYTQPKGSYYGILQCFHKLF